MPAESLAALSDVVAAVSAAARLGGRGEGRAARGAAPPARRGCPWFASQSAATMIEWARSELGEVADELKSPAGADPAAAARLDAEIGDLLFDALLLAAVCARRRPRR